MNNSCNPADTGWNQIILTNTVGCDSIVATYTQLTESDSTTLFENSCNPADTGWNQIILTNTVGCDSIVATYTQLTDSDSTTLFENSCNPADTGWNQFILTNTVGCDSIVATYTQLTESDSTTIFDNSCNPADTGWNQTILTNTVGCDSIVATYTQLTDSDSTTIFDNSCNPADTGWNQTILTNTVGCDSIIATYTQLTDSDSTTIFDNSCNPADTGWNQTILTNTVGCDSIIATYTNLLISDTINIQLFSCIPDSLGRDSINYINSFGCDSLVITTTSLDNCEPIIIYEDTLTCIPEEEKIDTLHFLTNYGLDSLVIIRNIFSAPDTTYLDEIRCDLPRAENVYAILQNSLGCDSTIIKRNFPDSLSFDYNLEHPICVDDNNGIITITNERGGILPYDYSLDNMRFSRQPIFENLSPGVHTLFIKDASGCEGQKNVVLNSPKEFNIFIGRDTSIMYGDSLRISYPLLENEFLHWSGAFIQCDSCPSQFIHPSSDSHVKLRVIDSLGCIAEDIRYINIDKERNIYIPNVFSPNDDGINDQFTVFPGRMVREIQSIQIYNRWGATVYEQFSMPAESTISYGWNGKQNGNTLNPGVFVYRIIVEYLDGSTEEFTGDLTLIK